MAEESCDVQIADRMAVLHFDGNACALLLVASAAIGELVSEFLNADVTECTGWVSVCQEDLLLVVMLSVGVCTMKFFRW